MADRLSNLFEEETHNNEFDQNNVYELLNC